MRLFLVIGLSTVGVQAAPPQLGVSSRTRPNNGYHPQNRVPTPLVDVELVPPEMKVAMVPADELATGAEHTIVEATDETGVGEGAIEITAESDASITVPAPALTTPPSTTPPLAPVAKEIDVGTQMVDVPTPGEVVRERFEDGKIRIERQVALDADGNFVNHGAYQEWNRAGDLIASGNYMMGVRDGEWLRMFHTQDAPLFKTAPYTQFKAPFTSKVAFESGQMNGTWTIVDADQRVVSEIQLATGMRQGMSIWRFPSGVVMYEANYDQGLLDGLMIERDAKGIELQRATFHQGQRSETVRDTYASKKLKTEYQYLTPAQLLVSPDDFSTAKLAVYEKQGDAIKHGPFSIWFENGQIKAKGTYSNGVLDGNYESWYANGQRESSGNYQQGEQDGEWVWWHENGMRRAVTRFVHGQIDGTVSMWKADGQRMSESEAQAAPATPKANAQIQPIPAPVQRKQAVQSRVNRR